MCWISCSRGERTASLYCHGTGRRTTLTPFGAIASKSDENAPPPNRPSELTVAKNAAADSRTSRRRSHPPGQGTYGPGGRLHITRDSRSFWVHLEPIGDDNIWRVAFHRRRGCFASIFLPKSTSPLPSQLKSDAESIIRRLSDCNDLRWVSDDEAEALW